MYCVFFVSSGHCISLYLSNTRLASKGASLDPSLRTPLLLYGSSTSGTRCCQLPNNCRHRPGLSSIKCQRPGREVRSHYLSLHISDQGSSAQVEQVSSLIIQTLGAMTEAADPHVISTKHKAIGTIIIFAISLEPDGQPEMLDVAVCALRWAPCLERKLWLKSSRYTNRLFAEPSSPSLNWAIALISPYRTWDPYIGEKQVTRWATAALAVPYTEEVGQSVVATTLRIASEDSLRPHIPISIWALFKGRPSLLPACYGRWQGTKPDVIRYICGLGDLKILKSYFLLV